MKIIEQFVLLSVKAIFYFNKYIFFDLTLDNIL